GGESPSTRQPSAPSDSPRPAPPSKGGGGLPQAEQKPARGFVEVPAGLHTIGHEGDGYSFDNEGPAHQVYLRPVRMTRGLVTNAQWLDFIADGGYATPSLWLSDGWAVVESE